MNRQWFLCAVIVFSACRCACGQNQESYTLNSRETKTITEYGYTVQVVNNASKPLFISTRTLGEWESFVQHSPANVVVTVISSPASNTTTPPANDTGVEPPSPVTPPPLDVPPEPWYDAVFDLNQNNLMDFDDVVELNALLARYDFDGNGSFTANDYTVFFNTKDTVAVERGDFNNNGRVDFADVTTLYSTLLPDSKKYDLSGNAVFDSVDVTALFNKI